MFELSRGRISGLGLLHLFLEKKKIEIIKVKRNKEGKEEVESVNVFMLLLIVIL